MADRGALHERQALAARDADAAERIASSPQDTEGTELFGARVSLYAKLLASVFGALYVGGIFLTLTLAPAMFIPVHKHPAKIMNAVLVLLAAIVWRVAKRPNVPRWFLTASDFALPIAVTLGASVISASSIEGIGSVLVLVIMLLMILSLVLRAALIPSPPQRTLLIGFAASVPLIITSYGVVSDDPLLPAFVTPKLALLGTLFWSAAITLATSVVSREIYGLQKQVQNARRLGQYTLLELLGEGGMGAVYRARHAMLRRPTAVKLLLPERAGPENIARFEREVQLTSMLTHPNTVAVYDFGRSADNTFYYAMEYLDGLSLQELVERYGAQPEGRVLHILLQASDALSEAHGIGLIHRDIKPANILLCERGGAPDVVKIVDFGLVKELAPNDDPALTHAGSLAGTPLYLAPETISSPEKIDHRVDIYALGAVGYFLLTGEPVFAGKSAIEVCGHHLHTPPVPPSVRLGQPLSEDIEALILRCLAKSPEERPANAHELHEALLDCSQKTSWSTKQARAFWKQHRQNQPEAPKADSSQPNTALTRSFSRTFRVLR